MAEEEITEHPLAFCRLCEKNKPIDEFETITVSRLGNVAIKYRGCHACAVVVHNATLMIKETVEKFMKERSTIIKPSGVIGNGPRG